ncbi:MAG: hypothetical protein A2X22_05020 [Bacteroidetes bacterium GWF2_49_14]|nr:MAG: hypothetical protein A2X22_05020 [Bacteroidetes bacterium GWF2_49_14]HBB90601.1 hypothetical protein [Bacteroidales bacterium]
MRFREFRITRHDQHLLVSNQKIFIFAPHHDPPNGEPTERHATVVKRMWVVSDQKSATLNYPSSIVDAQY